MYNKTVSGIELQFIELQLFEKENNNFQSDWNSTIINKGMSWPNGQGIGLAIV